MGKNIITVEPFHETAHKDGAVDKEPFRETALQLVAEEGASLSSGSLRLYALPYGCIDLYNYDPVNRRAAIGIMVAAEYRRQGYALAMLKALERLFVEPFHETAHKDGPIDKEPFHETALHTLYADIAAPNTASLALFRKAGYTQCGHFKEWLEYDSHYIDTIRMQKIL